MKKYIVTYRGEFVIIVKAKNKEDAIKKANISKNWELILQDGHADMYEVEEE